MESCPIFQDSQQSSIDAHGIRHRILLGSLYAQRRRDQIRSIRSFSGFWFGIIFGLAILYFENVQFGYVR